MRHALVAILVVASCNQDEPAKPPIVPRDAATRRDAGATDAGASDAAAAPALTAIAIASAGGATCAVMSDHTVRCWGRNDHGQLGDGTTADHGSPVTPKLRGVTTLAMGGDAACAIVDDKSVACWGRIGWRGAGDVLAPTGVLGVTNIERLWVIDDRACARSDKGAVVCWGDVDAAGRAGHGKWHRVPTPVVGLDHVTALLDRAALHDDGTISTWADDGVVKRTQIKNAVGVAIKDGVACGWLGDGSVSCEGARPCKDATPAPAKPKPTKHGKTKPAAPPAAVAVDWSPGLSATSQLVLGVGWCGVAKGHELECTDGCGHAAPAIGKLGKVVAVDTAGHCAIEDRGGVACWSEGRMAKSVAGVAHAASLAAGTGYDCALTDAGDVLCWGDNAHGELGRGDTAPHGDAIAIDFADHSSSKR